MYNEALNELPTGQKNAHLDDDFVMRVGIPHSSGRLAAHAFNEDFKCMVSASAFWNRSKREFHMPEATDLSEVDFALDSAGYTGILNFRRNGRQEGIAGVFPWSFSQYMEFANLSGCSWYSQADLCCEKNIANDRQAIEYHVRATATLLEGMLQILYAWQNELARTCNSTVVANMLRPPVPVLQGRVLSDYMLSLDLLNEVWGRWEGWLDKPALIGVGSMCRRDLHDRDEGLYAIVEALGQRSTAKQFPLQLMPAAPDFQGAGFLSRQDASFFVRPHRTASHRLSPPTFGIEPQTCSRHPTLNGSCN